MVKQFGYGETNAVMVRSTELLTELFMPCTADGFKSFDWLDWLLTLTVNFHDFSRDLLLFLRVP